MGTIAQQTDRQEYTNGSEPLSSIYTSLYPSQPYMKMMYKSPLLLWRLGLGSLMGQLFMIITTTGRRSTMPRRTVVEYRHWYGKKYALAAWPESDWYRNIQADPYVTIQTSQGSQSAIARRVTDDAELGRVYDLAKNDPVIQGIAKILGFEPSRHNFIKNKEQYHLLAFEPTDEPTPLPLERDLLWVWPLAMVLLLIGMLLGRKGLK